MIKTMEHIKYMKIALKEAQKAKELDEVPIGAVIVLNGKVIAKAHNLREKNQSATAHAEVLAINKACKKLNSWRLNDCILYVTLEPCTMCVGASILSRVDGIVYGAKDPKGGSFGSLYDISLIKGFNHYPWVVSGVCEEESASILKEFFKNKRKAENKQ
jgi:tRNA(adenine34) deaminase